MEILASIAALVGVGAITPGPNNLAVMNAAARSGLAGALPAIAGIVAGSVTLYLVVALGAGVLFESEPRLRTFIVFAGSAYLVWLGARLINEAVRGAQETASAPSARARAEALGLFGFQFLNPKGWALVMTVASAAEASVTRWIDLASIAALFIAIPTVCLLLWSFLGALFTRYLARQTFRAGFDAAMGSVLIGSAVLLLLQSSAR